VNALYAYYFLPMKWLKISEIWFYRNAAQCFILPSFYPAEVQ
jgi:hypothetical protein